MSSPLCNLRDVARAANCCVATVSRALRNHPSIPLVTRERIRMVAAQLGYRPNARISELMGVIRQRQRVKGLEATVAMYWSDATKAEVHFHPHLSEMEVAARSRLESEGFGLDLYYNEADTEPKSVARILKARGTRGLILAPLLHLPHRHLRFDWDSLSVVIAGSGVWRPEFHRVRFNHFEEMGLILHHVHHRGFRRIGLATDLQADTRSQRATTGGFWARVSPEVRKFYAVFESNGADRELFLDWLKKFRPEVLIASSWDVVEWQRTSGVDCAVVVTNTLLSNDACGIYQSYGHLAEVAAEQLLGQLTLNQTGIPEVPRKTLLTGVWQDRQVWAAAVRPAQARNKRRSRSP